MNKSVLTNLVFLGIFIFGLYPLIPHKYEGFSVALLAGSSIIFIVTKGKNKRYTKTFYIVSSLYVILFASSMWSSDKIESFNKMETMLSLLILPIVFYLLLGESVTDFSKIRKLFLKSYYVSSMLFTTIIFHVFTVYKNPKYLKYDSNFFRSALIENNYLGEHPIYVSIFISIAIIFGFSFLDKERKFTWKNFLILLFQGYLIILLILLMSKGVVLALIIALILNLIRQKRIKKVHVLSLILALGVFFILVPEKNNRFKEMSNLNSYKVLDENNSTSIRVIIYKCAVETIFKNPLFGVGIGDVQELLDQCYFKEKSNFTKEKYNSHNQYLYTWLSAGIIGVLIFLSLLGYYFKKAIQYNDSIMFSVLVLYCIIFLFENVLSRQSGVIFFSFILNYFLWDNLNRNKGLNYE